MPVLMQEVREPLDAFQHDQLHKIMSIMGPFSETDWPGITSTLHWKRNTQQIKTPHREYHECLEAHLLRCNPTLSRDPRFERAVDLIKQCGSNCMRYHCSSCGRACDNAVQTPTQHARSAQRSQIFSEPYYTTHRRLVV